jgi:hypothetical protein
MMTFIRTSLVVIVALGLVTSEAAARGRGRGRGGQQGMQGRTGAGGYNAQAAAMQRQMMQYRYRQGQSGLGAWAGMGQQQQLRDGSCLNQLGYGTQGGRGQSQTRGNRSQRGNMGSRGRGQGMQASTNLTQAEIENLLVMREEEKLARDVYLTLADRWNVPIFTNIARSESRHMTVVGQLIQKNGLNDPVTNDAVGSFTNPRFSELYDELVEAGSRSVNDAYKVGVKIEEMDIKDLENSLAQVSNSNVRRVYQNLLRASQNHLRAFSSQL